jgi:hypothetical protein
MSFFRKLFGGGNSLLPKASDSSDPNAWWFYAQCNKCGAPLAIRVDLRNDISTDYETGGRYLRKEMMDGTCFQLMYAEIHFDSNGNITEQSVERGKILTRAEYEQVKAAWDAKKSAK